MVTAQSKKGSLFFCLLPGELDWFNGGNVVCEGLSLMECNLNPHVTQVPEPMAFTSSFMYWLATIGDTDGTTVDFIVDLIYKGKKVQLP